MSYSVITGGEDWTQVATINGWRQFREWTETLDGEFGELSHFIEYGWSQKLDELKEQIETAVKDFKPTTDVKDIATTIANAIANRKPSAGSIVLTDGLTEKEDGSGWESGEEEDEEET